MNKKLFWEVKNWRAKQNILEQNFLQEKIVRKLNFWEKYNLGQKSNIIHQQMAKQLTFEDSIKW